MLQAVTVDILTTISSHFSNFNSNVSLMNIVFVKIK